MASPLPLSLPQPASALWSSLRYTWGFYNDILGITQQVHSEQGDVAETGRDWYAMTALFGPEAVHYVLQNRDGDFSSEQGWNWVIDHVFPGSIMAMDGQAHRFQRRIMQQAFKKPALVRYLEEMGPRIVAGLQGWHANGRFLVYPAVKQLTLDLATAVFMGEEPSRANRRINRAFVDTVEASITPIRVAIPGSTMWKGRRGRRLLENHFRSLLAEKRRHDTPDFFSQFCHARAEDDTRFSDDEIINHMIFLMMAAHDTTTSTLATIFFALAKYPRWQERLRDEARALGPRPLTFEQLDSMRETGWVMREALRRYPPLPVMPRRAVRDVIWQGHLIPAGRLVGVAPIHTHHMPELWPDPMRFDPLRFADEEAMRAMPAGSWTPFGGGAHMCIGQHFAELQIKAVMHQVLQRFRWRVPPGYEMPYQLVPIAKPRDNLPVILETTG